MDLRILLKKVLEFLIINSHILGKISINVRRAWEKYYNIKNYTSSFKEN